MSLRTSTDSLEVDVGQSLLPASSPTFTGLTLSGLTQGSVLFAGASGVVSQDNANFFWDVTNHRLGIGTAIPSSKLVVSGSSPNSVLTIEDTAASGTATLKFTDLSGNDYTIGRVISTGFLNFNGVQNTFSGYQWQINNGTNVLTINNSGNVGVGTVTPGSALQVNGGAAIGYSASTAAPTNGLQVAGALKAGTRAISPTNTTQSTPADPAGTTSTIGVMMGLAGAITPTAIFGSGNILVHISGTIFNPTAIGDGANVQLRYGTGTAPLNAAALTGTTAGGLVKYVAATTAEKAPFSLNAVITGLTLGTAYWLDVGLAAVTGGTATITDVSISAVEV